MKAIKSTSRDFEPYIILVRPQLSENMGMVARAMMNCALSRLRLVHPREDHLNEKAKAASSGAFSVLENAQVFSTLEEALSDISYVLATTARKRDMTKPVVDPEEAVSMINKQQENDIKTAILFGAERTGLLNEELVLANTLIEIPLNPIHPSLNLSQAVLIMGYEWFKNRDKQFISHLETGGSDMASKEELVSFFNHLETELEKRGYFRFADKKERMKRNLRNIFTRNQLTKSEIKTLHGVICDLIRPLK